MSKLLGGLFSRPSGKASGLVFGAGRTKRGKQVTAREYTIPTDPKTNAQVSQRGKMPWVASLIQEIGRDVYQFDFNRAVKNLPGYQSLSSIFMKIMSTDGLIAEIPPPISLGTRYNPGIDDALSSGASMTVEWSTDSGDVSSPDDVAVIIVIPKDRAGTPLTTFVTVDQSAVRSDGSATFDTANLGSQEAFVGLYFKSNEAGVPSRDRLSEVLWVQNAE